MGELSSRQIPWQLGLFESSGRLGEPQSEAEVAARVMAAFRAAPAECWVWLGGVACWGFVGAVGGGVCPVASLVGQTYAGAEESHDGVCVGCG